MSLTYVNQGTRRKGALAHYPDAAEEASEVLREAGEAGAPSDDTSLILVPVSGAFGAAKDVVQALTEVSSRAEALGTEVFYPVVVGDEGDDGPPQRRVAVDKAFMDSFVENATPGAPYVIPTVYGPACHATSKRGGLMGLSTCFGLSYEELLNTVTALDREAGTFGFAASRREDDALPAETLLAVMSMVMCVESILPTYLCLQQWDPDTTMFVEVAERAGGVAAKFRVLAQKGELAAAHRDSLSDADLALISTTGWGKQALLFRGVGFPGLDGPSALGSMDIELLKTSIRGHLREPGRRVFTAPNLCLTAAAREVDLEPFSPLAAEFVRTIFMLSPETVGAPGSPPGGAEDDPA